MPTTRQRLEATSYPSVSMTVLPLRTVDYTLYALTKHPPVTTEGHHVDLDIGTCGDYGTGYIVREMFSVWRQLDTQT